MKVSSTEALMTAAARGNVAKVRECIAAGVTLATKSKNALTYAAGGWWGGSDKPLATRLTLLRELVAAGCPVEGEALFSPIGRADVEIVRFLIEHGADVNVVHKGETPLGVAIKEANRGLMNIVVKGGLTSLASADEEDARQLEIIRALIKAGANVNQITGPLLGFGYTMQSSPLHKAVASDHPEVIRLLHEAGADLNATDKNKNTPLLFAVALGHLDGVKALIAAGADLNKVGEDGWTALALAREQKDHETDKPNPEIIQALEAASARVPRAFSRKEDFIKAAARGDVAQVKRLIADGVGLDVRSSSDCRNCTALALAAEEGHLDVVETLLAAGATVDAGDFVGRTPLLYAAKAGRLDIVRKLLAARANTEAAFKEVYEGFVTPLVMAAEEGHIEVVRALLKAGANVSHRARSGKTALTAAAANGHTEVVRVLAEAFKKARKDLRLLDSALWWAVVMGNAPTVEVLLAAGASPHATGMFEGRIHSALQMAKRSRNKTKLRLLEAALKANRPAGKRVVKA